jgi:magnesium chelatase accessory protein
MTSPPRHGARDVSDDIPGQTVIEAGGWRWRLQRTGQSPRDTAWVLLLHGTGASVHSWNAIVPSLAERAHVVLCDLPGHGGTVRSDAMRVDGEQLSLDAMTRALDALVRVLRAELPEATRPALFVVGHSAGAALALSLALSRTRPLGAYEAAGVPPSRYHDEVTAVLGVNPALVPPPDVLLHGVLPWLTPMLETPWLVSVFDGLGRSGFGQGVREHAIDAVLSATGSLVDQSVRHAYHALFQRPAHAYAVLQMMANWNLASLLAHLPGLGVPVTLLAAHDDPWVPRDALERVTRMLPRREWCETTGGHLLPEARPGEVAQVILEWLARSERRPVSA